MAECSHTTLELLPAKRPSLRCRYCHLTISAEELGDNCCPECFEKSGKRHYEFEALEVVSKDAASYRCADCGALIKSP